MQEQVDREAIAITARASKLTAQALAKAMTAVLRKIQQSHDAGQAPQGRQSVKSLLSQNVSTSTIEISGDRGLFDRVARKWNVDYAFRKTGPKQYLLLFKAGQADAITAAFAEYSKRVMGRAHSKQTPIREQIDRAARQAERQRPQERERTREAARDDR